MSRNKLGLIILLFLCGFGMFIGYLRVRQLEKEFVVFKAQIINVERGYKNTAIFVKYVFFLDKTKKISGESPIYCYNDNCLNFLYNYLMNKSLTIVYQRTDPSNSKMLFRKLEYLNYGVEIPSAHDTIISTIDSLLKVSN